MSKSSTPITVTGYPNITANINISIESSSKDIAEPAPQLGENKSEIAVDVNMDASSEKIMEIVNKNMPTISNALARLLSQSFENMTRR